jgi:hypothetical protein
MLRSAVLVAAVLALTMSSASALVEPKDEMESGLWDSAARFRSQWTSTGRAAPDARIKLTFAIKQRSTDMLERALYAVSDPASPYYGQHLSRQQVDEMVAPEPKSIAAVKRWLMQHELVPTGSTGNEYVSRRNLPSYGAASK